MAKKSGTHSDASEEESKLIRHRIGYYRNYKSPGYVASKRWCQVHHIIPCATVSDSTISTKVDDDTLYKRVQQCLDITNWDINAKDNCLGLPLKRAFYFQQAPAGWNGWPCHQVDHLAYNEEVATDLNNLIWKKVSKSTKKCRFKAKALEEALKDRSEVWLGKLRKRGNRLKGTKYHWDHRAELGEDVWFVPFSMADPPKKWSAPKNPSEALKKVLRKLMKAIGL